MPLGVNIRIGNTKICNKMFLRKRHLKTCKLRHIQDINKIR